MSKQAILWHRTHSKNASFTDSEANKIRPICEACVTGELRQGNTDHHRIHRPMPTIPGQCFAIDAFTASVLSVRGFRYCDLMRDLASQAIYCHFTKDRSAAEIIRSFKDTWALNPSWQYIGSLQQSGPNSRFLRMDSERCYQAKETLYFISSLGYKIESTPPRDKHAGGVAERTVGLVTSKTNTAMQFSKAPQSYWCWAMYKTTQDLNMSFNKKIMDSPYHFITGEHVDVKYLHAFFADCWMFIPLKDRTGKLPAKRAQRCRFLCYAYTTLLYNNYMVVPVLKKGAYGTVRTSKDVIFDETYLVNDSDDNFVYSHDRGIPLVDVTSSPALVSATTDASQVSNVQHISPTLQLADYTVPTYWTEQPEDIEPTAIPLMYIADPTEFRPRMNLFGHSQNWNSVTSEWITPTVQDVTQIPYQTIMNLYMESGDHPRVAPRNFRQASALPEWHAPILKELDNFQTNSCFQWIPDTGQRRLFMIWLFSFKANFDLKARMVIDGSKCVPGLDYDPSEVYCGNVQAASVKIFFALSALYGLTMRGGDLVGAYLVTPGSKDFKLCISTPPGIKAPPGMILEVLGNLYGLPSSGRNFSMAVDKIVLACGYTNTVYDPKFFVKWIDGMPILLMFHSDDFRWSGSKSVMHEWDILVKAFEESKYKVKDCTADPFVGINVSTDEDGNYYLNMKEKIEGVVKVARNGGAPKQKLPYPYGGPSLSKADNAKDDAEAKSVANSVDYRKIIGMLSYIMAHTKPDIAYALNVLSRYCNNPGPRHVQFLLHLVKYCEFTKDERIKYASHPGPYDKDTMKKLTQARFQCDADLAGNWDNGHSTSSHLGYIGKHHLVSYTSKTQGSLSTSTAESEIKAVNMCLKDEAIAMRGMLILMGFPQDATVIEEDNLATCYSAATPHLTRGLRHLDLTQMFVKYKVIEGDIVLEKVSSMDNTSDIGTKRLALPLFNKLKCRIIDQSLCKNL